MPIVAGGAQAENFPDPDKFKPERWSRDNKEHPNPFASLPFGFGARMCVGTSSLSNSITKLIAHYYILCNFYFIIVHVGTCILSMRCSEF